MNCHVSPGAKMPSARMLSLTSGALVPVAGRLDPERGHSIDRAVDVGDHGADVHNVMPYRRDPIEEL
jgi:hypothetical protein